MTMAEQKLYIHGSYVDAASGEAFETVNPASGEVICSVQIANFYTQGEICTNGTRVFVAGEIHDEFLARLLARTGKLKIGHPMDPETQIGAMIRQESI